MTTARLILASSSPRRRELLSELGLPFSILKPEIDEDPHPDEAPLDYVQRLAYEKALTVASRVDLPVLAADTVVILAADTMGISDTGEILAKPRDAEDARQMLRRLRARDHRVCTAFTLLKPDPDPLQHTELVCTTVTMRAYTDSEIEAYIATGDPFDKAGSYAIQHPEFRPVSRIDGSYSNVVGLPMEALRAALTRFGLLIGPD